MVKVKIKLIPLKTTNSSVMKMLELVKQDSMLIMIGALKEEKEMILVTENTEGLKVEREMILLKETMEKMKTRWKKALIKMMELVMKKRWKMPIHKIIMAVVMEEKIS